MDHPQSELDLLRAQVAELTSRVYRLELALQGKSASAAESKLTAAPKPASETPAPPQTPPAVRPTDRIFPPLENAALPPQTSLAHTPLARTPLAQADLESRIGSHWLNRIGITTYRNGPLIFNTPGLSSSINSK